MHKNRLRVAGALLTIAVMVSACSGTETTSPAASEPRISGSF